MNDQPSGISPDANACTTSPLCSPARASIITGQYPHTHGITDTIYALGCMRNEIQDSPSLLPRQLQRYAYNLGYSGKWHLGSDGYPEHIYTADVRVPCTMPRDLGFAGQDLRARLLTWMHETRDQAYQTFTATRPVGNWQMET